MTQAIDNNDEFEAAFQEAVSASESDANEVHDLPEETDESSQPAGGEQQQTEQEQKAETVEERLERLERERADLEHKYTSNAGRIAAYQRQVAELQQQIQSVHQSASGRQEAREELAQEINDSSWDELQADFPEIARAIDARFQKLDAIEQRLSGFEKKIQPIEQQALQARLAGEFAALEAAHPDYREVVQSPDFADWIETQPAPVKQLMHSDAASDAAYLLETFKAMTGRITEPRHGSNPLQAARNQRLQNAISVPSRRAVRRELPEDDFEAAWAAATSKR